MTNKPTDKKEWKNLLDHHEELKNLHLRDLFTDKNRINDFSYKACDLFFDFSKNRISNKTIKLLVDLAKSMDLKNQINDMFSGEKINRTEKRSVLHTALRSPEEKKIFLDEVDVSEDVHNVLGKMKIFSEKIYSGQWSGFSGKKIKNIVNIGIGGSDLGPVMAYEALKP